MLNKKLGADPKKEFCSNQNCLNYGKRDVGSIVRYGRDKNGKQRFKCFTRCPKCEEKTKIRKYCLAIHIDPKHLFSLNKSCRYCPTCDLIIVKQTDLEGLLTAICEQNAPEIVSNDYFVLGTMDRKDWQKAQTVEISQQEAIKRLFTFKDAWKFDVIPAGWYHKKQVKS